MKRSTASRALLPATIALATALAGCGASNENGSSTEGDGGAESVSGRLSGAGASSQAAGMEAWIAAFGDANPDASITYDPVGSGGGREQFSAGAVQFAGSDAYLEDEELAAAQEQCGGAVIELPNYIAPIAVIYNLEGVDDLQLSPSTIAKIFDTTITTWNDPAIAADNPGVTLPDQAITAVHRADDSGTTDNFTEYLAATASADWSYEPDGEWPTSSGEAGQGTQGVVGAVSGAPGGIGYADLSQAGDLGVAKVKVGDEFVEPSAQAASAIVDSSEAVSDRDEYDLAIDLDRDTTESGTYPIVQVSYHLACPTYDTQEQADLVKAFLGFVVSEDGQQVAADAAGSAPISEEARERAEAAIESISAG